MIYKNKGSFVLSAVSQEILRTRAGFATSNRVNKNGIKDEEADLAIEDWGEDFITKETLETGQTQISTHSNQPQVGTLKKLRTAHLLR